MRRVPVIIGMGRSGTSLLGQILYAMGYYFGEEDEVIGRVVQNPLGQMEHIRIQDCHNRLLNEVFGIETWLFSGFLQDGWERSKKVQPFKEELKLIVREMNSRGQEWAFKDARTTRLLPLWNLIFEELDVEPIYLLTWRNPEDVLKSLKRAGKLIGKEVPEDKAAQLHHVCSIWAEYMQDAMTYCRPAAIVQFERWFTDARRQADMIERATGKKLPDEYLEVLIDPKLQHFKAS